MTSTIMASSSRISQTEEVSSFPGGGIAFVRAISSLEGVKDKNADIQTGIRIVKRSLEEPLRQIATNAGLEGSVIVREAMDKSGNEGFDAASEKWVDMVKAGIIDPTKVVRIALQDAASVAGLLVTTEAMVAEKPEKKEPMPAGAPDMGGMGGMGF